MEEKLKSSDFVQTLCCHDIIVLSECWINECSVIELPGYDSYVKARKKRARAKRDSGGIVVLINSKLSQGIKPVEWNFEDGILFCLSHLFFEFTKDLFVFALYLKPENSSRASSDTDIEVFDIVINKIAEMYDQGGVILLGDLNARTATQEDTFFDNDDTFMPTIPNDNTLSFSDITDANLSLQRENMDKIMNGHGHNLLRLVKMSSLLILNGRSEGDKSGKFTFCNHRGSSTIDYAIVSRDVLPLYKDFKVSDFTLFSDHAPIILTLSIPNLFTPPVNVKTPKVTFVPQWNSMYEHEFSDFFENEETNNELLLMSESLDNDDMSTAGAEILLERFCQLLHTAGRNHSKRFYSNAGTKQAKKNKSNDWFDKDCCKLKETFKEYERQFRINNTVQSRLSMCRARNAYRKRCRLNVKRKNKEDAIELTNLSKKNSRLFWKRIKNTKKSASGNCDFTEYFKKLGSQISNMSEATEDLVSNWEHVYDGLIIVDELDKDITIEELNTSITTLKNNKAAGCDKILNEFIKHLNPVARTFLLKLFNFFFLSGHFPSLWSVCEIVPIHKKGDVNICENYRGISILSCLGKLFTSILNRRLNQWAEKNAVFNEFQFGFRTERSTVDCLFILNSALQKCLNEGERLFCSFVDLKRAFDGTNRRAMWFKLSQSNISSKVINVIKSMYDKMRMKVKNHSLRQETSQSTRHPDTLSQTPASGAANFADTDSSPSDSDTFFTSVAGVYQGESLSPFLFSMFINDIEEELMSGNGVGITFENLIISLILFADDMAILSKTKQGLQEGLNRLEKYCDDWGLTVNTDKTKCMAFKKGGRIAATDRWSFKGTQLETVTDFRYLGFTIGSSGSLSKGVSDLAARGNRALFGLKRIISRNPALTVEMQLNLFNSLVEPVMAYACESWGLREADQLEKTHLAFLKSILGVRKTTPSAFVYRELGVYPLILKRKVRVVKFWLKILSLSDQNPVKKMYNVLLSDIAFNNRVVNWASLVRDLLCENGYGIIWLSQNVHDKTAFINELTFRLKCSFEQNINTTINNDLSKNRLYRHLIQDHTMKNYLNILDRHKRIALTKIRLGSHNFLIERGRWQRPKIELSERNCDLCDCLEDEFHIIVECPKFYNLRQTLLDKTLKFKPSMYKFVKLLDTNDKQMLEKTSRLFINVLMEYERTL